MYDSLDNRKSQAFLIFYCSINLGAFLSPLVSGILHHTLGFGAGFLASSAAVLLGLVQYLLGLRHVPLDRTEDDPHKCSLSDDGKEGLDDTRWKKTFPQRLYVHRIRLLAILGICLLTVGFWGVYEQQGNTLPIFADQVPLPLFPPSTSLPSLLVGFVLWLGVEG